MLSSFWQSLKDLATATMGNHGVTPETVDRYKDRGTAGVKDGAKKAYDLATNPSGHDSMYKQAPVAEYMTFAVVLVLFVALLRRVV